MTDQQPPLFSRQPAWEEIVSPPVPEDVQDLPYPACYSPESCRGLTFCPHERTCTE
jgi:hypothetical protein